MNTIKAIETQYKGYRFRSRLEARWAVFFDAMSMKWEYEPEGIVLPSGTNYLPDFLIEGGCYVEVKPENVQRQELDKSYELAMFSDVFLAIGTPSPKSYDLLTAVLEDNQINKRVCPVSVWPVFHKSEPCNWEYGNGACHYTEVIWACNAARSARFEHGENGPRIVRRW